MMETFYLPIKHLHISLVTFSVLFFMIRCVFMFINKPIHHQKWAKMLARIADTFLLVSAILLCIILHQSPLFNHWLTEKVGCLIAYILLAYIALYRASSLPTKLLSTGFAVAFVLLAATIAISKQPFLLG